MAKVRVERTEDGFLATNERGASVAVGSSDQEGVFSPSSCSWWHSAAARSSPSSP
ncbi:hypothetical protein ACFQY4_31100 [Catellatospora bangladeshensis]|uniref:hypothetical protein n=1 Tax=Catellatospora bangladeshensis TaxID=310355 RepID=UPI003617719E